VEAGSEWVQCKQKNSNDFLVIIRSRDNYDGYETKKNAIIQFFEDRERILIDEQTLNEHLPGYWVKLTFSGRRNDE